MMIVPGMVLDLRESNLFSNGRSPIAAETMTTKIYTQGLKLECVNRNAKFWINNVFLWNKVNAGAKYISSISNNIKKDCVPKIQHLYVFTWKQNRPAKVMMIPFYKKTFLYKREERCSNEINTMVGTQLYVNFNTIVVLLRLT